MKLKYSMLINITLLIALVFVVFKSGFHNSVINRLKSKPNPENIFHNTWEYKHETALYKQYTKQANVVMLGNSITYRANWNELLNRNDIVNRGIGNDITKGMLNRLEDVYSINPKICFVMGGINDLLKGIESEIIASNIESIIIQLKSNNIKPIISSVLYTAKSYTNHKKINYRILKTNELIKEVCLKHNVKFINLNASLSYNNTLKEAYSFDGIHLSALGYNKWKEVLIPIIYQEFNH